MGEARKTRVRPHAEPSAIMVQTPTNDAYGSHDAQPVEASTSVETGPPVRSLFFVPVLATGGQPANVDPQRYMLVTRFELDQSRWIDSVCFNIDDPNDTREYRLGTRFDSPHFGERPIVETFEELLHRYPVHRLMRSPFRPVPIRPRLEISFEDRLQDKLHCPLNHAIADSRDRQDADFSPVLRNLLSPCSHGPIRVCD